MRVVHFKVTEKERELLRSFRSRKEATGENESEPKRFCCLLKDIQRSKWLKSKAYWQKRYEKDDENGSKVGFASFPDQPRSGAPSKLSDEHRQRLKEWVDAEPLTSRALVNRLKTDCGIGISAGTLRNELKRMGYVWKRTRYSLKKA